MADLKILVVDDEARMRKLVKDFLTRENYIVKEAAGELKQYTTVYLFASYLLPFGKKEVMEKLREKRHDINYRKQAPKWQIQ